MKDITTEDVIFPFSGGVSKIHRIFDGVATSSQPYVP